MVVQVVFLMTKAGVTEQNIAKVIASGPELLGCSIVHKLDLNVKYFLSLGIRLPQLGEMIADFPMLLRYNVELLRPKYRYLRRVMVRPLQDVIEFPRYNYHTQQWVLAAYFFVNIGNQYHLVQHFHLICLTWVELVQTYLLI